LGSSMMAGEDSSSIGLLKCSKPSKSSLSKLDELTLYDSNFSSSGIDDIAL
jgi:hypothetical protein